MDNIINIKVIAKDQASGVLHGVAGVLTGGLSTAFDIATGAAIGLSVAMGGLLVTSIYKASNAQETYSKFATVFANVNDRAQLSVNELAAAYGLSAKNARQLVGDTGDLLTGFGISADAALDMSLKTNQLAVDLASFTNAAGGAEAVSHALTRAMLGERESLKSYGIAITEADIQTELLARSQSKLTGEALRQAKAQITLDLAYKQSKNAIGDFARTSDSFANRMRVASSRIDDFLVSLGGLNEDGTLKPGGPLDIATQILDDLITGFENNKEVIQEFVGGALSLLVQVIKEGFEFMKGFASAVFDNAPRIKDSFGGIVEKVAELIGAVDLFGGETAPSAFGMGEAAGQGFSDVLVKIFEKTEALIQYFIDHKDELKAFWTDIKDLAGGFLGFMREALPVVKTLATSYKQFLDLLVNGYERIKSIAMFPANTINSLGLTKLIGGGQNGGEIQGYSTGGYVRGPKMGNGRDNILVRAEEGEVILNKKQQDALMSQLNAPKSAPVFNFYGYDGAQISNVITRQMNYGY